MKNLKKGGGGYVIFFVGELITKLNLTKFLGLDMNDDGQLYTCALYHNFWGVKDFDNSLAATLNMFPSFFGGFDSSINQRWFWHIIHPTYGHLWEWRALEAILWSCHLAFCIASQNCTPPNTWFFAPKKVQPPKSNNLVAPEKKHAWKTFAGSLLEKVSLLGANC